MPQSLLQNSVHEKRRNMSKRSFVSATGSNGSRMPFATHFKAFEPQVRICKGSFKFLRIHSNALERTGGMLDA
jgi:hypothetical protein